MWRVAKDPQTSNPIYFRECTSDSGHIGLIVITEEPFRLKFYPNTFLDELYRNKQLEHQKIKQQHITINEQEALVVEEEDLASFDDELLDYRKLRSILSEVIIDTDVDAIIDLVVKLDQKH
ncbi:hypothetical protein [Natranaerobius trueperi]|uniref:Uncharacterized protein n=1 Tax=Natranaerobius trueperi TaxID=759412 RepID=A0A226BV85_9FIRM|nr:hypothetical protein [Natranaerobius trueperi]OWZ82903.1 hypothetical protein CDO51_11515 [Natranaerobius trueperi]